MCVPYLLVLLRPKLFFECKVCGRKQQDFSHKFSLFLGGGGGRGNKEWLINIRRDGATQFKVMLMSQAQMSTI